MSDVQSVRHTFQFVVNLRKKSLSETSDKLRFSDHVGLSLHRVPSRQSINLVPHVLISPLQFMETVRPTSVQWRSAIQICGSF